MIMGKLLQETHRTCAGDQFFWFMMDLLRFQSCRMAENPGGMEMLEMIWKKAIFWLGSEGYDYT